MDKKTDHEEQWSTIDFHDDDHSTAIDTYVNGGAVVSLEVVLCKETCLYADFDTRAHDCVQFLI